MSTDVVIPVYRNATLTRACVEAVLTHSGPGLGRVFVVDDASPEPALVDLVRALRDREPHVRVFHNPLNLGFVRSANLGIAASREDVVVLNSDAIVRAGWLERLTEAFRENPSLAALSPLSNHAGLNSVPEYSVANRLTESEIARLQLDGLPACTTTPTAHGFCMLLRRRALDELGFFDPAYGRGYHEENDWCQRARARGWSVGRANRVFVFHEGEVSFQGARAQVEQQHGWRLAQRYPNFFSDVVAFGATPEARLAARAARASLGRLTEADFAFLRPNEVGPADAAHVALLETDVVDAVASGSLDAFLLGVQGVIAPAKTCEAVRARWPTLRCLEAGGNRARFLEGLALAPDAGALAAQRRA